MKLVINIEKHHFYILAALLISVGVIAALPIGQAWDVAFHSARTLSGGEFGADVGGNANTYTISTPDGSNPQEIANVDYVDTAGGTDTTCDGGACNIANTGTLDGYEGAELNINAITQCEDDFFLDGNGDCVPMSGGPGGVATTTLPAENISAGVFGQQVGEGDFAFPGNLLVASEFRMVDTRAVNTYGFAEILDFHPATSRLRINGGALHNTNYHGSLVEFGADELRIHSDSNRINGHTNFLGTVEFSDAITSFPSGTTIHGAEIANINQVRFGVNPQGALGNVMFFCIGGYEYRNDFFHCSDPRALTVNSDGIAESFVLRRSDANDERLARLACYAFNSRAVWAVSQYSGLEDNWIYYDTGSREIRERTGSEQSILWIRDLQCYY